MRMFYPMQPAFARSIVSGHPQWRVEPKMDGWRCVLQKESGRLVAYGRRIEKGTRFYVVEELLSELAKAPVPDFILDCELTVLEGRNRLPSLVSRSGMLNVRMGKVHPILWVFDIMKLGKDFINHLPYRDRKRILRIFANQHLKKWSWVKILPDFATMDEAVKWGSTYRKIVEGVVFKKEDSRYKLGEAAPYVTCDWQKLRF